MKTTTRYEPGDRLHFLQDNKICCEEFNFIEISIRRTSDGTITRTFMRYGRFISGTNGSQSREEWMDEDKVFKSKKELLASL